MPHFSRFVREMGHPALFKITPRTKLCSSQERMVSCTLLL